MKTLYESILDDEDEVMSRMGKNVKQTTKDNIINFIVDNYSLDTSDTRRPLEIKRYIKINKDWTVDIKKSTNIRHSYVLRVKPLSGKNKLGTLPTNNLFTWNEVQSLHLDCSDVDKLPVLPKKCGTLYLQNCKKIKSMNFAGTSIGGTLEIRNAPILKYITLNSNLPEMFNFQIYYADTLEMITGLPPKIKNEFTLYDCPKLWKLSPTKANYVFCYNCDSLEDEELKQINYNVLNKKP